MKSIVGLKPGGKSVLPEPAPKEATADEIREFAKGAAMNVTLEKPSYAVFKRTTFSLTDAMNADIDTLSLVPRTFKVSRSDVVRAGVLALKRMDEEALLALLTEVSVVK